VSNLTREGGESIVTQALSFSDLVLAGVELVAGQLGIAGVESISTQAGRLLFEQGVVASTDDGIVLYHESISKGKPSLARLFRSLDRRAGRLPKVTQRGAQRAVTLAMRAGEVKRQNGKIVGFTNKAKAAINAARRAKTLREQEIRDRKQKTALAKLQGIGGTKGRQARR